MSHDRNTAERKRRAEDTEYANAKRATTRASVKAWRLRHPEKYKAMQRDWYERNKDNQKARAKARYYADPEAFKARSKAAYRANRAGALADQKRRTKVVKDAVYMAYGGYQCVCCGEIEECFLTIDHIDGCTKEQRAMEGLGSRFYRWLKKHQFPVGYRVLCFNCNIGREKNGGTCPHQAASSMSVTLREA